MARFEIGSLVVFSYSGEDVHDRYPHVLVLHSGWRSSSGTVLLHGLNFNYLTNDEINMLRMLIDPGFNLKYFANFAAKDPTGARDIERILTRGQNANITSPYDFYHRIIKWFIQPKGYDPYRTYNINHIQGGRIIQPRRAMLGDDKKASFGTRKSFRGAGQDENQILQNLAQKQSFDEKNPGKKTLTPTEIRFIKRLQGRALTIFKNYKRKFEFMKGPNINHSMPSFKKPNWMEKNKK